MGMWVVDIYVVDWNCWKERSQISGPGAPLSAQYNTVKASRMVQGFREIFRQLFVLGLQIQSRLSLQQIIVGRRVCFRRRLNSVQRMTARWNSIILRFGVKWKNGQTCHTCHM